jgi:GT2 family glycosyltransferase
MTDRQQTFSVLLCTYNRHSLLRGALHSLVVTAQEKPDQIVVVNGGDERADDVVRSFCPTGPAEGPRIQLIKTVNKNLAASRNAGLAYCDGDLIAMTDDDAEVFPDWVAQMKSAHREHPEAGAIGGPVLGVNAETIISRVSDLITFPSWPEGRYIRTLPGVNISYKREAVDRVGPQDETLFRGEDVDYNWRVKQLGYEVYFDPAVRVYHHHRPTWRGLLRQHYMYGRAYYLVRRKWPDMYCVYPHQVRGARDILKAANTVAGVVYQPVLASMQLPSLGMRLGALPLLFLAGISWKGGMMAQAAAGLALNNGKRRLATTRNMETQ